MVAFSDALMFEPAPRIAIGRSDRLPYSACRSSAARRGTTSRALAALLLALVALLPGAAMAANVDATWNGGTSNWNNISNWSGAVVPNNGGGSNFSVFIDGGKPVNSVVTLDISPTITNLTINSGDQLNESNGIGFAIAGGAVANNGIISLQSTGANTDFYCFGAATLSGSGSIQMSNNGNNRILTNDTVCVHAAGHTIRGAGQVLADSGGMQNGGTIIADQPTSLLIDPNARHFVNTGMLQAQSGATLRLVTDLFTNLGGLIQALNGSTVSIEAATITGGTITTAGSGLISVDGASFGNVTNNGAVITGNGRGGAITGTWTDNGTWTLNSTGANTDLDCLGGAMITGPGVIAMSNNGNNRILTDDTVCIHTVGHSIHGSGQVLANSGGMQNAGTITADQSTPLAIDPNGRHFVNTGTLQAFGGATLRLITDTFTNAGGLIQALDASTVSVESAAVVGGLIATSGSGAISVDGGSFTDVTSNAGVVTSNGRGGTVAGTLTNNGTWLLNSSGANTDLLCAGSATLSGPGSIIMSNNGNNRLLTDNSVCKHAASHTIHGSGQILADSGGLQNAGVIIADQSTQLLVDPNALGVANTGKLQAKNGATLRLAAGVFTNTNGLIEALDKSAVAVSNASVVDGTMNTSGTGVVSVEGSTFTNVLSTAMAVTSNGQAGRVMGTLTNNGVWSLSSTGANTDLNCFGAATIAGSGSISMSDNTNNRILTDDTVCTHGPAHTIHGAGQLLGDSGGMINNGMIIADLATPLTIDPNGRGFTNAALVQATGGGTLRLAAGAFDNSAGMISALNGSLVSIESATVTGGQITSQGTGVVRLDASTLAGLTSTAAIQEPNGRGARITGTIVNNSTWSLLSSGANTDLLCADGATLSGTGSVLMSNNTNNRILTNDTVCVHAAGHTIRGGGQVLADSGGMQNAGTIIADQASPLFVDPNGRNVTNTGTLRADGGTLVLQFGGFVNDNGTIEARDGSTVHINGASISNGTMTTSGTGVVSAEGGSSFTNVTSTAAVVENNGQGATINGSLINNATWTIASSGANTDLNCIGGATLSGSGSVAMSNNGNNRILTNDTVCTNAAGHTIRGAGQLLANTGGMLNQGTIVGDQATQLTIDPNGRGFTNEGAIHAMGAGGIFVAPDPFTTSGTVLVDAGSSMSRSGAYTQTAGTTTVNGTLSATGLGDIQGGVLQGTGTVAATVSNAGQVNPGTATSPGLLTVNGTYTQLSGGTFNIDIGGPTVGTDYDRLAVSGMATLAGTINISLRNNFKPTIGSTFTIMTFSSHAGDFTTYNGLTQPNGVVFTAMFTPSSLILTVVGETTTATPTNTALATTTPTRTATASITPTPTGAATATRTATGTMAPSNTPSSTPSSAPSSSPTPSRTSTATSTLTAVPTGTSTQTSTQTHTLTPTATATGNTTPAMVILAGRVLSPGRGGTPGDHDQVPVGGAPVDLFLCPLRQPCLGTGTPVASVVTDQAGRFQIQIARDLLQNVLPVVAARISPTLVFRAPVLVIPAAAASFARQLQDTTETIIDAISESVLRILEEHGIQNFDLGGISAVVGTVQTANADTSFADLTPEQGVALAQTTALADPAVQMALADNQFTPTPTPPPSACVGDCNDNGEVTVDEVIKGVNIDLGNAGIGTCPAFDVNGDGMVTVNELILGVNNVLSGCH